MPTVNLLIYGNREDCLAVVELLSHTTPIVVHEIREPYAGQPRPASEFIAIDAAIPSTVRSP